MTITHDDTRLARWFLFAGIAFAVLALFNFLKHPAATDKVVGCLGATAVFSIFFLAAFERSVFTFDRGRRVVGVEP